MQGVGVSSDEFREHVDKTINLAAKMKKRMLDKDLKRARAPCPDCPGKFLNGSIVGPRNHMWFHCDCKKYVMME